jgi:multimeric flavodoxin WrbA
MSKKVLAIHGSPRKKGNSIFLAKKAIEVLENNKYKVNEVTLQELEIKPCKACEACRKGKVSYCTIKDDMQKLYKKVESSDILLVSSPIYWFTISSQLKLFIDRLYGLYNVNTASFIGKKIGIILTYGDDDPLKSGVENAINTLRNSFDYMGADIKGIVSGTAVEIGDAKKNTILMEKAVELGKLLD